MSKTSYTFNVLQATAAVASLAIIMWSLGFPTLQFAQAANVTNFSNTMTDSAPGVVSDHTIEFVTPTGVAAGETIVLTFDATFADIATLDFGDLDLNIDGTDATLAATAAGATWGAVTSATDITFTSGTGTVGAGETVIIEIGLNADAGDTQITNPGKVEPTPGQADSYPINLTAGSADSGETRVAIVEGVTVTATVDTIFTFSVTGIGAGQTVTGEGNGLEETGGATTATEIPFGELEAGTASTAAQGLEVQTNAANGFSVTVAVDQQLTSSTGADINGFADGSFVSTPAVWAEPTPVLGQDNTYGHWAISTRDATLLSGLNFADGANFVSASTTPVEVFHNDGPSDGSVAGTGQTTVVYRVQTTELQEAADDYTATLTYVATPVF